MLTMHAGGVRTVRMAVEDPFHLEGPFQGNLVQSKFQI